MKKAIKILYIILIIVILKLIITFTINEIYISKFEKEEYDESLVKMLRILNFPESYIAPYNYGNLLYKEGRYSEAINQYDTALKSNPPKKKECSIRINKALCILKAVDLDNKTAEENIEILYEARDVLCEDGCANIDNDVGHSKEAEKLKKEIDDMIEELKNQDDDQPSDPEDGKEEDEPEDGDDSNKQNEIEEQLKENQAQAGQERQGGLQELDETFGEDSTYSPYGSKNW